MSTSTEKISPVGHLNLISKDLPELKLVEDEEGFYALKDSWEELIQKGDFTIFQTFEWNWAWWKYFGDGKNLHILTLFDKDGSLICVAPFFRDTFDIGNNRIYNCLRFLGSSVSQPRGQNLMGLHPYSDYLDLLIKPGYEEIAASFLVRYLQDDNLDYHEVVLDEIPKESNIWKYLLPKLEEKQFDFNISKSSVCPVIKLGGSWDDYQNSLSKKQRYNNNRALRMVDEKSKKGFHVHEIENEADLQKGFDLLVNLHQKRWNQLGFPGAFAERRMYDFMKQVVIDFYKRGWVQLRSAESVKEKGIIAVDLLFEFNKRTYLVHRALDQDSYYSKYGPGNVLLSVAIKRAAELNMEMLDFLRGEEAFKFRTANDTRVNKKLVVKKPGERSSLAEAAKRYVAIKRRCSLEWAQLNLFLKGETLNPGLKGFYKFLQYRIKYKLSRQEK